jgi:hypothetical protein
MIIVDYQLSDEWKTQWVKLDLERASETDLRYSVFLGDFILIINSVDFSARWGWIPLLDLAIGLKDALKLLDARNESEFEFTESNAKLVFVRSGDSVLVEPSYSSARIEIQMSELQRALSSFVARLVEDLEREFPRLSLNQVFIKWKSSLLGTKI